MRVPKHTGRYPAPSAPAARPAWRKPCRRGGRGTVPGAAHSPANVPAPKSRSICPRTVSRRGTASGKNLQIRQFLGIFTSFQISPSRSSRCRINGTSPKTVGRCLAPAHPRSSRCWPPRASFFRRTRFARKEWRSRSGAEAQGSLHSSGG